MSHDLVDISETPGLSWNFNRLPENLDLNRPVDMHAEGMRYSKVKDQLSNQQMTCFTKKPVVQQSNLNQYRTYIVYAQTLQVYEQHRCSDCCQQ
jgi:hypothetical protein